MQWVPHCFINTSGKVPTLEPLDLALIQTRTSQVCHSAGIFSAGSSQELAESMPKKSHQMQISPVQNTIIPEKGMWDCYTVMREVRATRMERKPVGHWECINTTDMVIPAWTDCSHRHLQGEDWSQAWFYFQQKQQVINLHLIIETNGLTPSPAEHNTEKKLKNID